VPLADVVARAVDLYRDVADAKGVSLEVQVEGGRQSSSGSAAPSGKQPVVLGDRTRLEQVAANLIDNAIKYTPPGGRVRVAVGEAGGRAEISVHDTGPGIPPDELPRIWDRLFRGDASRAERGLGLGLSLVRAIATAHGGTAEVLSEPGRGATFIVRLPQSG